jgi:hypothetical protein
MCHLSQPEYNDIKSYLTDKIWDQQDERSFSAKIRSLADNDPCRIIGFALTIVLAYGMTKF